VKEWRSDGWWERAWWERWVDKWMKRWIVNRDKNGEADDDDGTVTSSLSSARYRRWYAMFVWINYHKFLSVMQLLQNTNKHPARGGSSLPTGLKTARKYLKPLFRRRNIERVWKNRDFRPLLYAISQKWYKIWP